LVFMPVLRVDLAHHVQILKHHLQFRSGNGIRIRVGLGLRLGLDRIKIKIRVEHSA